MKVLTPLVMLLWFIQSAIAQNTEILVFYSDTDSQKQVLNINKKTNGLILTEKESDTPNNYFDALIVKSSVEHTNSVYIILAQENKLFLKRNGTTLEFEDITKESNTNDRIAYEWEIQYVGYSSDGTPIVTISDPSNERNVIFMEGNRLSMKIIPESNWNLANNTDSKGQPYRFKIQKIANTF